MKIQKELKQFLLAPEGGESGSAGLAALGGIENEGGGGGEGEAATTNEGGEGGEPATTAPAPALVDAKALAEALGGHLATHFKQPEPPAKELTPEEAKKLLNVWEPTPEWITKYDNLDTRAAAIAEQRDGLIKQADTVIQYRLQEAMRQIHAQYGPIAQQTQQAQEERVMADFHKKFPALADPNMKPIIDGVSAQLRAAGKKFNSNDEVFSAIAKGVEAVIKHHNPSFSLGAPAPTRPNGSIPVTTPGAGGGAARGNGGAAPTKSHALSILGPVGKR